MADVNLAAHNARLYVLSGGSVSVSYGGYLTGGGHSALSAHFGMAADSVLELEVVSPSGEFLTLNECQNTDLFWATRGVRFTSLENEIEAKANLGGRLNFWHHNISYRSSMAFIPLSVCLPCPSYKCWKPFHILRHCLSPLQIPIAFRERHKLLQ